MAHLVVKDGYHQLADRLNRAPQGAPATERLFQILALLFSEREAQLVSQLPMKPFTAKMAAQIWKVSEVEARKTLETLASRAILLDAEQHGEMVYVLPPPMAGFFEFSLMRVRDDIDQKLLSELFYEYITVEEGFMRALLLDGETPLGRTFVNELALEQSLSIFRLRDAHPERNEMESKDARLSAQDAYTATSLQILDYERTSEVIETAQHMGVGVCYCRHKAQHVDLACDKPLDICISRSATAPPGVSNCVTPASRWHGYTTC